MSRRMAVPANWFYRKADPLPDLFPEPHEGDHYWNTTREVIRVFHDGQWRDAAFSSEGGTLSETVILDDNAMLTLNNPTPSNQNIEWRVKNLLRWTIGRTNVAETGGDAGSNFSIASWNDAGNFIKSVLGINRATGEVTVAQNPTSALGVSTKQYTDSGRPFANAAARDAAIPSPVEGMYCWLNDIHQRQVYFSGSWKPTGGVLPYGSIVLATSQALTAATTAKLTFGTTANSLGGGMTWNSTNNAFYGPDGNYAMYIRTTAASNAAASTLDIGYGSSSGLSMTYAGGAIPVSTAVHVAGTFQYVQGGAAGLAGYATSSVARNITNKILSVHWMGPL